MFTDAMVTGEEEHMDSPFSMLLRRLRSSISEGRLVSGEAENSMGLEEEGGWDQCELLASGDFQYLARGNRDSSIVEPRVGADSESSSGFLATHKTRHFVGSQRECHGNGA